MVWPAQPQRIDFLRPSIFEQLVYAREKEPTVFAAAVPFFLSRPDIIAASDHQLERTTQSTKLAFIILDTVLLPYRTVSSNSVYRLPTLEAHDN